MPFPRPARPATLIADFKQFMRGDQRHKFWIALVSLSIPALAVAGFAHDAKAGLHFGPRIVYVHDWPASRTDAEIIAQQKIDQAIREKKDAEKRAAYQRLAKQLGM